MANQLYPESHAQGVKRIQANLARQKAAVMEQRSMGQMLVADITVSHGFFVDEVANAIGAGQQGWCEYCAVTSYRLTAPTDP